MTQVAVTELAPIRAPASTTPGAPAPRNLEPPPPERTATDRVELSASDDAEPVGGGDLRVREIRARIAAGTYVTDHKIEVVVDRLLALFRTEGQAAAGALAE